MNRDHDPLRTLYVEMHRVQRQNRRAARKEAHAHPATESQRSAGVAPEYLWALCFGLIILGFGIFFVGIGVPLDYSLFPVGIGGSLSTFALIALIIDRHNQK